MSYDDHFLAKIEEAATNIFLALSVVATIWMTNFGAVNPGIFFECLRNIDKILFISPGPIFSKFPLLIIVVHLQTLLIIAYDSYSWIVVESLELFLHNIIRNAQYMHTILSLGLLVWMTMETSARYKKLTERIEDIFQVNRSEIITNITYNIQIQANYQLKLIQDIRLISRVYNILCNVVDTLNSIFGATILFYCLFVVFFVVEYLTLLILFGLSAYHTRATDETILKWGSYVWIAENCIKIMALASAGENLSREANRTITVCYGIINTLDNNPQYNVDAIKEELNFLIQQAAHRKPCLSASGFFVANSTMMGFIIGSITSYVIVAVQFLKETSP
ncbi:uncharacterized protein [Diabrotica undecimpunctata]|uniref:uncharacterized protein isoform X2 n=1 Tax=Diabrotica undecimpunctata TaxID=50387 RepID=UPI003B633CEF